jgi:hypothetical protein
MVFIGAFEESYKEAAIAQAREGWRQAALQL